MSNLMYSNHGFTLSSSGSIGSTLNSTACECSSSIAGIFGTLNELEPILATCSIIIIIAAVVLINHGIFYLFIVAKDTPFELLLTNIEHELMIVGFTSFVFKIFISFYPNIPHDWHVALEYADVLVPIIAFIFCLQGLLLIIMTLIQTNIWIRNYHLPLEEILDKFYKLMNAREKTYQNMVERNIVQEQMKFRIYRLIFCDQYRLTIDSLAFDRYVLGVYEKYLFTVIEIDIFDWLFVIFCMLINLGRTQIFIFTHSLCADNDIDCVNLVSVKGFAIVGALVLIGLITVAYVSYYYEKRLLQSKNVTSAHDYAIFLKGGQEEIYNLNKETVDDYKNEKFTLKCGSIVSVAASKRGEQSISNLSADELTSPRDTLYSKPSPRTGGGLLSYFQLPSFAQSQKNGDGGAEHTASGTRSRSKQKSQSNLWRKAVLTVKSKTAFEPKGVSSDAPADRKCLVDVTPINTKSFFGGFFKRSYNKIAATSSNDLANSSAVTVGTRIGTEMISNYKPDLRVDTTAVDDVPPIDMLEVISLTPAATAAHSTAPFLLESVKAPNGSVYEELHRESFTASSGDDSKEDPTLDLISKANKELSAPYSAMHNSDAAHQSPSDSLYRSILRSTAVTAASANESSPTSQSKNRQQPHSPTDIESGTIHRNLSHRRISFQGSSEVAVTENNVQMNTHNHKTDHKQTHTQGHVVPSQSQYNHGISLFTTTTQNHQQVKDLSKITSSKKVPIFAHLEHEDENPLGLSEEDRKKIQIFQDKMDEDIISVYINRRPDDYFNIVKLCMIAMSIYFGLWFTNYCYIAYQLPAPQNTQWIILSLIPAIVGIALITYIIRCAALLKAMSICDTEVISQVLEETEQLQTLAKTMREKIIERLEEMGDEPIEHLRSLFEEIDVSKDGKISQEEFEIMLQKMGIKFSRRNWEHLFRQLDRNCDSHVMLDELMIFTFPDNQVVKREESIRLKKLQVRIKKETLVFNRLYDPHKSNESSKPLATSSAGLIKNDSGLSSVSDGSGAEKSIVQSGERRSGLLGSLTKALSARSMLHAHKEKEKEKEQTATNGMSWISKHRLSVSASSRLDK